MSVRAKDHGWLLRKYLLDTIGQLYIWIHHEQNLYNAKSEQISKRKVGHTISSLLTNLLTLLGEWREPNISAFVGFKQTSRGIKLLV